MQVRAAKAAAKREAAEREWRVHQVAGELARQADLLEKHRHRVAQEASDQPQAQSTQVSLDRHSKAEQAHPLEKHGHHVAQESPDQLQTQPA